LIVVVLVGASIAIPSAAAIACDVGTEYVSQCPGGDDVTAENSGTGTTFSGTASGSSSSSSSSSSSGGSHGGGSTGLGHNSGSDTGNDDGDDDDHETVNVWSGSGTGGSSGNGGDASGSDSTQDEDDCESTAYVCGWTVTDAGDIEEERTVTLKDLARFEANGGVDRMEPDGWIVTGLPTNFYATARRHIVAGRLFNFDAYIRYTPFAWHWDFGDGSRLDSESGGASWKSLEQAEFSETSTSHIYREPDNYTITLSVDFYAEYQYAGADVWRAVPGHVTVPTDPLTAIAGKATTVLVGADCGGGRTAPGC
jgi:hypothetical protein